MKMKTNFSLPGLVGCALALLGTSAMAAYPDRPIKVIMPFPPGGSIDLVVRLVTKQMSVSMGQPFILEYKPGAGSNIATEYVANAPADGYTVLLGTNLTVTNPLVRKSTRYKVSQLAPVSLVAEVPLSMTVSSALGAKTPLEFVERAKAQPGMLNFADIGLGTSSNVVGTWFQSVTGTKLTSISYKGGADSLVAVARNDVALYFDSVPSSLAQAKAGNVRILGITSAERLKGSPEIPTLKEQGLPMVMVNWYGFYLPVGTPSEIINRLHSEVVKAVANPEYQARLIENASIPVSSSSPAEFGQYAQRWADSWWKIVEPMKLQLE